MLRRALLALMVVAVLSTPLFFVQAQVQAEEPSLTFARAGYDSPYTGFKITTPTQDGGRADVIFVWEIGAKRRGEDSSRVYATYPILQMVKLLRDGSLDYSLTYIPLYLIQFDDANANGIFDVRTRTRLTREVSDEAVDWKLGGDRPLQMYPLAPMLARFEQGEPSRLWSWTVSDPTRVKAEDALTYDYVWDASASVKSFGWRFIDYRHGVEGDTIDVHFGYRLALKPEGPTVKFKYSIEGAKWASGKDVKLAFVSAALYHGRDEAVVREEGKFKGFSGESAKDRMVALVEGAGKSVKSLIAYSSDAVVDRINRTDVVTSALQPLFVVSTPSDVPEGANVKGMNPGFGDKANWRHYVAFAHQLTFPRFDEGVFQDPVISLAAPLLIPLPTALISPQWFVIAAGAVFAVYALLRAILRRSLREAFPF